MKDRTKPKEKAEPNQKPAYRFQCSNVTASVFPVEYKRDGVTHFSYNVVIDRSYKDGDEWKNTKTFRFSDLHKVITVAQKAFEVISMNRERLDGQSPSTNHTKESRESEGGVMTGGIKCKTKGGKCPQCNWQSPVLYRLEGEWMCANCFCEALVEKGYSIVPEDAVEHSLLRIADALEHMCVAGIGVRK